MELGEGNIPLRWFSIEQAEYSENPPALCGWLLTERALAQLLSFVCNRGELLCAVIAEPTSTWPLPGAVSMFALNCFEFAAFPIHVTQQENSSLAIGLSLVK